MAKVSKTAETKETKSTVIREEIRISPPNFKRIKFTLEGTAPLLQHKFGGRKVQVMMDNMAAGSTTKKGKKRDPRDFEEDFKGAMHISSEGWCGVPAASFRNACIDVCRMANFKMTHAKMSIFVEADGFDSVDGQPLVKLIAGKPEVTKMPVRNATGVADIRVRPMWRTWKINITVRFDADQFTAEDVANLISRAGEQCGIGEGRPYSKISNGMGYGTFRIANSDEIS
jgi:hypothetical protein